MARLQLNKSSLAREARNLRTYERFLPSLDLKRQQLMAERAKAARGLAETRDAIAAHTARVGAALPMLADDNIDLTRLARITRVALGEENIVGNRLPTLEAVEIAIQPYAMLASPHWVDRLAEELREMLTLRVRAQVEERRLTLLEAAVKTITQRVNLFEKVLIPRARTNMKRIRISLSDEAMAGVVRSKISKNKRAAEARAR